MQMKVRKQRKAERLKQIGHDVPWTTANSDEMLLKLHHDAIDIPPPTTLNHSTLDELGATYHALDGEYSRTLNTAAQQIQNISESETTTSTDIVAYTALALAAINSLTCISLIIFLRKRHYPETISTRTSSLQPTPCAKCPRPVSL